MEIQGFLEIEKKYNLNQISVADVNYWNYVRFSIWNYMICAESLGLKEAHKKKHYGLAGKISVIGTLLKNSFSRNRIPTKDVDVLFLNHERRVKKGSFYECAYTERLTELFPNSVPIERPFEYRHFTPVKTKNLMYADRLVVTGNLYYQMHKKLKTATYRKLYEEVKEQLEQPLTEMEKVFSWKANRRKVYNLCMEKIMLHKSQYPKCKKLLEKLNPKVIIEVVHYSQQKMLFNEIAKKMGIPTIELQHGTMYPEHAAYQYAKGVEVPQLPDYVFLFSEFWKKQIHLSLEPDHLIVTGYPLFDEQCRKYQKEQKKQKRILFISQVTIGGYLSELAVETAQLYPDYKVVYKLHPAEYSSWRETYPELQQENIQVIDSNEKGIYYYFSKCDIQVGVYSTAIFEGLGFGLETLIYRVGHYDVMEGLVEAGYAYFIDSAEEIGKYLMDEVKTKQENVFWKTGALDNMKREMDNLVIK